MKPPAPDTDMVELADWPGYRVHADGTVWGCRNSHGVVTGRWRQLRPTRDRDGYLLITLSRNGVRRTHRIAALVLTAFVGPAPAGMESCHWPDTDPTNNAIGNLRWATHRENIADKVAGSTQARGVGHAAAKLTEADVLAIRAAYPAEGGYVKLGRRFGVSSNQIRLIVKRRNWKHI